jgi:hypothetical protein
MHLVNLLEYAAAFFALSAAVFWFLSASKDVPTLETYWDAVPTNHPFITAMRFTAKMNRWAAILSGLSALCVAASIGASHL